MMAIQDVAYTLLADASFADVTVDQIAESAGVGPATVYRYFGSKDRILSWNEHDDAISAAVSERIAELEPFVALRTAFVSDVAPLVDNDRQRAQFRIIYATPDVSAAMSASDVAAAHSIAKALIDANPGLGPLQADVFARAALGALEAGFFAWQEDTTTTPLAEFVDAAFDALAMLSRPGSSDQGDPS